MKARTILITTVAVLLLAPTVLVAQGFPGGHGGQGPGGFGDDGLRFFERMLPRMAEHLGLTDEQQEEIGSILDTALPEIRGYIEDLAVAREAYHQENDPENFDETVFRAFAESQVPTQIELKVAIAKTHAAIYLVLTPEQREQLGEMKDRLHHRAGRRRSPGAR